jgi:MoxR-like ATPase
VTAYDFDSPHAVADLLETSGYLCDAATADGVFLAARLGVPVLVEGPAGVGKTELAKSLAAVTGTRLIRLQCYEGLDEGKALYEWDYRKQLLRLQAAPGEDWAAAEASLFGPDFLLERPLLAAIRATDPVVLLIDEVDRLEVETEALLLEVLAEFQVTIPELGTIAARTRPLVFLTSNGTRELSEALKRRCLFLEVGYPDREREAAILRRRVPELDAALATQVARIVHSVRRLELRKPPSVSESIDWARALNLLGVSEVDGDALRRTLPMLVKYTSDSETVIRDLQLEDGSGGR